MLFYMNVLYIRWIHAFNYTVFTCHEKYIFTSQVETLSWFYHTCIILHIVCSISCTDKFKHLYLYYYRIISYYFAKCLTTLCDSHNVWRHYDISENVWRHYDIRRHLVKMSDDITTFSKNVWRHYDMVLVWSQSLLNF